MKKVVYIILFTGVLFSCNDDLANSIFPDKYVKILSLKETGIKDIDMNTTQGSVIDSILILKGGGRPNTTSNMELKVLSKEAAAAIGGYELSDIRLIPTDSYDIAIDRNIVLEDDEDHKYVPITFYPAEIYAAMKEEEQEDLLWVLPIALESSSDTINNTQNKLLMRFDVNSPLVEWEVSEDENAEIVFQTLDVPLKLKISHSEENISDFTLGFDLSENENLVNKYNDSLSTNYTLLPSGTYSLRDISFTAGEGEAETNLQLSRSGLQTDETYLLPLKLSGLSVDNIEKTERIRYLVITNPKYVYQDVDRGDWEIAYANCQEPWDSPNFYASSMIDDDTNTAWASNWGADLAVGDDFDYSYSAGYPACTDRRDIPNMVVVIDMGREVSFGGVGFNKSTDIGHQDLKACEFYLSDSFRFKPYQEGGSIENYNTVNDGNNWGNSVLTCTDIPQQVGTFWYYVDETELMQGVQKGRYLKFRPTASHRGDNFSNLNELYLKELISIEGNAVK